MMSSKLPKEVRITDDDDDNFFSEEVLHNTKHQLNVGFDEIGKYVVFKFSSRLAMYEFGKSLMQEAVFGRGGQAEYLHIADGKNHYTMNGVRLAEQSARVFVFYPNDDSDG